MRTLRLRHLVMALLVYLPLAASMFGPWPGFVNRVSAHCAGLPALDMRGYWNAADARTLIATCDGGAHRAYLQLELADLVYPAAAGAVLVLATALLLRNRRRWIWPALTPAIVMTLLDYTENAGIWVILLRWPSVSATVADAAGVATAIKHVLGFVAFSLPLVLAIALVCRRAWRSVAGHRRLDSSPGIEKRSSSRPSVL